MGKIANAIDAVVGTVSPGSLVKRKQARLTLTAIEAKEKMLSDTIKSASTQRRQTAHWANRLISPREEGERWTRETLMARSAGEYRNNPIAKATVDRPTINIVGTGLNPQSEVDEDSLGISADEADEVQALSEQEWQLFSEHCDWNGMHTMSGLQELALKASFLSGDCFANTPYEMRPGDIYGTKVQLIDAARIVNPAFMSDTTNIRGGIQTNSTGMPVGIHVLEHFPGDYMGGLRRINNWSYLPIFSQAGNRRVCHIGNFDRIDQLRPLPLLTPILEPLYQLNRYKDAEIMAAVISACFTVFVKTTDATSKIRGLAVDEENDEAADYGADKDNEQAIGEGIMTYLMPNESVEFANPTRPSSLYDQFVLSIYKEIGAALNIPIEELLLFYQSSYSAARASIIQAYRYYLNRRKWFADQMLKPIWCIFFDEAVALGRIPVRNYADPARRMLYQAVSWVGTFRGHIDEERAVNAADKRVKAGFSFDGLETAQLLGVSARRVYKMRAKEVRLKTKHGLPITSDSALPVSDKPQPPTNIDKELNGEEDSDE